MATTEAQIRIQFFDWLFKEDRGYVCIATQKPGIRKSFKQYFFDWPRERTRLAESLEEFAIGHNVWFCVNQLSRAERKKALCIDTRLVWADLDACNPEEIEPRPQAIIESSPGRYQAIWRLNSRIDARIAEDYSKRIAYRYQQSGADISGWDLTQLLRVPFTRNFKYGDHDVPPLVQLHSAIEKTLPVGVFESIPPIEDEVSDDVGSSVPDPLELPPVDAVLYKYLPNLQTGGFKELYTIEPNPDEDWSRILWRLINTAFEVGMTENEVFVIASNAACNKYKRDNRPAKYLWRDVLKAKEAQFRLSPEFGIAPDLVMPVLVPHDMELPETFLDRYRQWAIRATDAVPQYHDLSAAILLSAVIAQGVRLETSYGKIVPNLWGMILGDSTLTRKTTAMRMAMEFINEIDREMVLATDGSVEGILTGLSVRPSRTSIFLKDEISGFFDSINRKEYLAGMAETFTQLYDVPPFLTRRLRKEIIDISSPIFIFFGGGIRDKVVSLINEEYILSGFLPRFLIVAGETDIINIRRTGPPKEELSAEREKLKKEVADLYEVYGAKTHIEIGGEIISTSVSYEAELTEEAWSAYGEIEFKMVEAASESHISMLALPTFERLSRSLLKLAVLLAASRNPPQEGILWVQKEDILVAARYIQEWGNYTIDVIRNSGRTILQRKIDRILQAIEKTPGVSRGKVMQVFHLTAKEMTEIQNTLEERGQIIVKKEGRATKLFPL